MTHAGGSSASCPFSRSQFRDSLEAAVLFRPISHRLGRNPSTKLPSICRKEALVEASEPVFYAFDIETPKIPLDSSNVEALELGVFQLNLGALAQIVDGVRPTMEHDELRNEAKIADIGAGMADFDAVSVQTVAVLLQALIERPLRTELPGICHLSDVGAMFPNIILTNLIEEVCMACIHNVPEAKYKRPLQWVWRGEIEFCRNAFKRLHGTEEVQKKRRMTTTICHREKPSLYVDNDEPTFRYKYKQMRKICINRPLPIMESSAREAINGGKSAIFAFVGNHCDDPIALKLHYQSLRNFLILNAFDVSPLVDDLSSVSTFKNAVIQMTEQLPVELKEHTGMFMRYFTNSLSAQNHDYCPSGNFFFWKTFKDAKLKKKGSDQSVDGHQLEDAKTKVFDFVNLFCDCFSRPYHIDTLWKCFGKGETVVRSDGLQSDLPMPPLVFENSLEQLITYKCQTKEIADSFARFLDSFVDSLFHQSGVFYLKSGMLSAADHQQFFGDPSSSHSSSAVAQQQQQELSAGPSSISSVVGAQQQQKDSSGISYISTGISSAQHIGQKRANTTDQCEHPPKKGVGNK
ncbi:hypothetical protein niasHT_038504 [Heterodera trifolii]|uniref:DNA polymerase epsilon catalytic subunit n=1 Tax=Heterodera trifolii TaxID=157864 RepID=A0ABD2ISC0_9BILA